jgi:hypothetical protein
MEATSTLPPRTATDLARRIDWNAVSAWLLGFGLIVYLGLKGGGYDPLVHDQVGIAAWWIVIAGVLVGAFPRRRLGVLGWCALGLLAAFAGWTALSLGWTESPDKTAADLARCGTYLGVFTLALFVRGSRAGRLMVAAVGSGIAFVAIVALLSRLHPAWFPEAGQTARFLSGSRNRLAYPINYWNGLATLVAIGLPLMLQVATSAKSITLRSLAAGALPAMALTIFFTVSRGGTGAAIVALAVFLALTSDRLPKLLTLLVAGSGSAILIGAATQRDALENGLLSSAAHHQGNEMLAMTIVVCVGVALVQAGISLALAHDMRPGWSRLSQRQSAGILAVALAAVLLVAVAVDAPGRASQAWTDFKTPGGPGGSGTSRLASFSGNQRYQYWSSAAEENRTKPLSGTGSGTFEYWWAQEGDGKGFVRDTHSLYLQTLGELGIVGLVLIGAFLLAVLIGGTHRILRASRRGRPQLAADLAGCVAFCVSATFDWVWQIAVAPIALLLLSSVLVTASSRSRRDRSPTLPSPVRVVFALVSAALIAAIAIPLSSSTLIRQSQADARSADFAAALHAARSAQNVQPDAATPRLQEALLLETGGDLAAARAAALEAAHREPINWRNWLVLSRIEAERGQAAAAVRHYRKARSLNPRSPIFS